MKVRLFEIARRDVLLAFAGFTSFVGLLAGNGALFFPGALLLSVAALYTAVAAAQVKQLEVVRDCGRSGFEGQAVPVRLTLINPSRWPVFNLEVVDRFEADLHPEKVSLFDGYLPPCSRVVFRYYGVCFFDRGVYDLGPVTLRCWDPFRLFWAMRRIPLVERFEVYPEIFEIEHFDLGGVSAFPSYGARTSIDPGGSQDYLGVREYSPGDPPRHIHWGQTAKRGELMVRYHEREVAAPALVVLDLNLKGRAGTGKESVEEYAVRTAASIAAHAVGRGCPTALLAGAGEVVRVGLGCGEVHLQGILHALIDVRHTGRLGIDELVAGELEGLTGIATTVVILSATYFHRTEIEKAFDQLSRQGGKLVAVLIDDEGFLSYEVDRIAIKNRPTTGRMTELLADAGASTVYVVSQSKGLETSLATPVLEAGEQGHLSLHPLPANR